MSHGWYYVQENKNNKINTSNKFPVQLYFFYKNHKPSKSLWFFLYQNTISIDNSDKIYIYSIHITTYNINHPHPQTTLILHYYFYTNMINAWRLWIIWGALAASDLVLEKFPQFKETLDAMEKGKWTIWVILFLVWVIGLIRFAFSGAASFLLQYSMLDFIFAIVNYVINIALWILLWYDVLSKYLPGKKAEDAMANAKANLGSYSEKLGIAAIIIGILSLVL